MAVTHKVPEKKKLSDEEREARGDKWKYGRWWGNVMSLIKFWGGEMHPQIYAQMPERMRQQWQDFWIERIILASAHPNPERKQCPWQVDINRIPGYQGWTYHFKEFISILFGGENSRWVFEWNPNAVQMLETFYANRFTSIVGCASSGKSRFLAGTALGLFMIDPLGTKIVVTSKTLQTAQGKVWGDIEEGWSQLASFFGDEKYLPGKKLANGMIRAECFGQKTHKAGLQLIAGEKSAAKKNAEKLQGFKRHMVLLFADELDTAEANVIETAKSNLSTGNKNFWMVGALNPTGRFTPGGIFCRPKKGWDSITEDDYSWDTELGRAIRFNAELSPNVLAGRELWKGLMTTEKLVTEKEKYGEKTASYYSQILGWFPPAGELDCIDSEMEIIQYQADAPVTTWTGSITKIAGLDIGYSHGGDRTMAALCNLGKARRPDGRSVMVCELYKMVRLDEDMRDKETNKALQIARKFAQLCREEGIATKDVAVDATAGGDVFAGLLGLEMGQGFLNVNFASSPSDMPVSQNDRRRSKDRFVRKVDELWYVGKELIRQGHIKGIDPDTITELCARTYKEDGGKVKVEGKDKMKIRTAGISPDRADALVLAWEIARQRYGLSSSEKPMKLPASGRKREPQPFEDLKPNSGRRGLVKRFAPSYLGWGG